MNGQNKLEGYITQGSKGLPRTNSLVYWAHSYVTKKIECCDYDPRDLIHNPSFYLWLINGPNKQECYIILGLKGLQVTNSQVYWAHSYDTNKIKSCDYDSMDNIHNISVSVYFMNGKKAIVFHYYRFKRLAKFIGPIRN
jgi:hypothetical protein